MLTKGQGHKLRNLAYSCITVLRLLSICPLEYFGDIYIMKTRLFKYTENFTTKKMKTFR